jgi:hypothetical protein
MDAIVHGQGSSLMHEVDQLGGAATDDIWFVPDDTFTIGYDQTGGVCGRPKEIYVTQKIDLGGTSNNYDPVLDFLSSGSCTVPVIDAFIKGSFHANVDGITTPFEIWSDTPYPIFMHSDNVLGTSNLDGGVLLGVQEAVAGAGDVDDRCVELLYEDGAGSTPWTMFYSSGAGQWVAEGYSGEYAASERRSVIGYGVVPQTLFAAGVDTERAGLEIITDGGLQLPNTITMWGKKTDAAYGDDGSQDGINFEVMADVNKATLDLDHVEQAIRWRDNGDTEYDLYLFKRDQMEIIDGDVAYLLGTDTDGGAAVGARVGSDEAFSTDGARLVEWVNDTAVRGYLHHNGDLAINMLDNGQQLNIESLPEELTIQAAATTTSTIQIPAGCLCVGVSSYVTTTLPGATVSYSIGTAAPALNATRFGTAIPSVVGSSDPGTDDAITHFANDTPILITPDVAPAAATGKIRITIHFIRIDPATS